MNKPKPPSQVKVGIIDDPTINAANAGNGEFYVTTGLLQKANNDQLLAIMAHEVAHDDLGHLAKAQALGTGLGIGAVILDQIIRGAGRVAPIGGALVQRQDRRHEAHETDVLLTAEECSRQKFEAIGSAGMPSTYAQSVCEEGAPAADTAQALADRCRAGVKVHVLLDAVGSLLMPSQYRDWMTEAGCEV